MSTAREPSNSRRYRLLLLSIIVAMSVYLLASLWAGKDEVLAAFARIGSAGISIALLLSLVNYLLRYGRWDLYLKALGQRLPVWLNLKIYLSGFALTTTPGKAGEMVRSLLLKQYGVTWAQSIAVFISERLSDLLAMFLLALPGVMLYYTSMSYFFITVAVVLGVALLLFMQPRLSQWVIAALHHRQQRFLVMVKNLFITLQAAQRCYTPKLFCVSTLISLLAWAAEAWAFQLILVWMGFEADFIFAASVYAVAVLVGALSFLPGGIGGTEAAMVALLLLKGMPNADAVAATVIIRLTTLWFSVVLGLVCLLRAQKNNR